MRELSYGSKGGTETPALAAALNVLSEFAEAPPVLLKARSLQERVDRKYLLPADVLHPLLANLQSGYRVVRSGGSPAARYRTRYFDTAEWQMYHDHRRGRRPRYKVRVRHHLDREMSFLEVKRKGNDDRTVKARLVRRFGDVGLDADARAFASAHCPIDSAALLPLVWVGFRRATLVGVDINERITLDWGLELWDEHRLERLRGVVIAEIKQARYANQSPSVRAFRALHLRERQVSKYCLAMISLLASRTNAFKPALRAMEQLSA
jgi:hypothetical protein